MNSAEIEALKVGDLCATMHDRGGVNSVPYWDPARVVATTKTTVTVERSLTGSNVDRVIFNKRTGNERGTASKWRPMALRSRADYDVAIVAQRAAAARYKVVEKRKAIATALLASAGDDEVFIASWSAWSRRSMRGRLSEA
jgi:hypothetical protein